MGHSGETDMASNSKTEMTQDSKGSSNSQVGEEEDKSSVTHLDAPVGEYVEIEEGESSQTLDMTPSSTRIYSDMVPPVDFSTELYTLRQPSSDEDVLEKAIDVVNRQFTKDTVINELRHIHNLYLENQAKASTLNRTLEKYAASITAHEDRQLKDPRVMKALHLASKHRLARFDMEEGRKALQEELVHVKTCAKNSDDTVRIREKEIKHLQEEVKKLKEVEKHLDEMETSKLQEEQEWTLQLEKHAKDIEELKHTHIQEKNALIHKHAEETELKRHQTERDFVKLEKLRSEKIALTKEFEEKQRILKSTDDDRNMKISALTKCENQHDTLAAQNRRLHWKICRTERTLEKEHVTNAALRDNHNALKTKLKEKMDENQTLEAKNTTLEIDINNIYRENKSLGCSIQMKNGEIDRLTDNVNMATNSKNMALKDLALTEEQLTRCHRKLHILQSQCDSIHVKCNEMTKKEKANKALIHKTEASALSTIRELAFMHDVVTQQKNVIHDLSEAVGHLKNDLSRAQHRFNEQLEEYALQKRKYNMLQKKYEETEKLMNDGKRDTLQLTRKYEDSQRMVTSQEELADMMTYQRNVQENQIRGLMKKLKKAEDDILTLSHRDTNQSQCITSQHKEITELKEKLRSSRHENQSIQQELWGLEGKIVTLETNIRSCEVRIQRLLSERDILGRQLMQSQVEQGLLAKKSAVMEGVMKNSRVDIMNKLNDIRVLVLEVRNLRRKLALFERDQTKLVAQRSTITNMGKEIVQLKAVNNTLSTCPSPRLHRWRALLASEPSTYELYLQLHAITRRLVRKTNEATEKEQIIHQKNILYMELKAMMTRRMTDSSELASAKHSIQTKNKQIKALCGELNMRESDVKSLELRARDREEKLAAAMKENLHYRKTKTRQQTGEHKLSQIHPKLAKTPTLGAGFSMAIKRDPNPNKPRLTEHSIRQGDKH